MRILWLSHFPPWPPTGNGALQRTYNLLRIASRSHEVHLVALSTLDDAAKQNAVVALSGFCRSVALVSPDRSAALARLRGALSSMVLGGSYYAETVASTDARAHVERLLPLVDLIYCDFVALRTWLPPSALTRPIVWNHHNVESQLAERRALTSDRLSAIVLAREAGKLAALEGLALSEGHNITVSNADLQVFAEQRPQARISVVPNGVDTEYFVSRSRPAAGKNPRFLFSASMGWGPNREALAWLLREIWPAIRTSLPLAELVVTGGEIPRTVWRSALPDGVFSAGFVPDVRDCFDQAHAVICPISSGGGTRLKALDAMAMSVPLIATSFAVDGLSVLPDVHYLRAETAAEFAGNAVRATTRDPQLDTMVRTARSHVDASFSWTAIQPLLLHAMDEATKERISQ